jgi:hypothetical protein
VCCRRFVRTQANQILGLAPGEIFVQRNVGNQAMHTDMNLMACLEFAVKALKVRAPGSEVWPDTDRPSLDLSPSSPSARASPDQ